MSILDKFRLFQKQVWVKFGAAPKIAPWTMDEREEVKQQADFFCWHKADEEASQLYGMNMYATPYADVIRARIVEHSVTPPTNENLEVDCYLDALKRRLSAKIATDISHVCVTVEYDPWSKIKRALRLTKYFPIKTQSFVIEGTVIYPYLKVNFPSERHHIKLRLK